MWNSGGDIDNATVEVVDPGPMTVSGNIDHNSHVRLRCTGGPITVNGRIDGSSVVYLVSDGGPITINGRIDGSSVVVVVSTTDAITITGKVDGSSNVTLEAVGDIAIGTQGGDDDKKIGGSSSVTAVTQGNITLGSYIHASSVDFRAHGTISTSGIDNSATVLQLADGDIKLAGKIDGSSRVEFVSNRMSITIDGKIDGDSKVLLTARRDIGIGVGAQGGDEDHKIDGDCSVVAIAGNNIQLGSRIAKSAVDFAAGGTVTIGGQIGYGASVRLLSTAGNIGIGGHINGGGTNLLTWPAGAANPTVDGGAQWLEGEWADPNTFALNADRSGYWWQNWGQTFGYVAPFRVVPRSVDEIGTAVLGTGGRIPDKTPVKAVGGGWSFTDAALPFQTVAEVAQASLIAKGIWQRQDLRDALQGLNGKYPTPMDLVPEMVGRNLAFSTAYDQPMLRQVTSSGPQLPPSNNVRIIDSRSLASSLQVEFAGIRSGAGRHRHEIQFHVEAGITMVELQHLLDHQHPRLAIRASGGSPGATLAGALATATHGGEFNTPLLADCVRAVHLVGPGGEQWWIEGDVPVADQAKLQIRYPKIDPAHFINAAWNGIPGLSGQDVLDAVVVSIGTIGVVYSMVLAVVPQFGIHQVVHPTSWTELLQVANTSEADLRAGIASANVAVLDTLIDGTLNGTGIDKSTNIYIDLAINPLNRDCWIVNREYTPNLPDDPGSQASMLGGYQSALTRALQQHAVDAMQGSMLGGRVFDFLGWGVDIINLIAHDINAASELLTFVTRYPDAVSSLLAAGSAQAILNVVNQPGSPDRGQQFLADLLSGVFHALEGTEPGQNAENTGVSYQVGAIGWPDSGLPGTGLEIALDQTNAFTFLQRVLFDDVLTTMMTAGNQPLIGYISIRVCPPTHTLVGMQQYSPYSVMIEVVAYRSPEAHRVMNAIQAKAIAWQQFGLRPLLHWGLENDQVTAAFLQGTPLGKPYKVLPSRLEAFKQIREYLRHGNFQVFNNAFSSRIGV